MHGRNAGGLGPACLLRAMMHYCDYILTQLPKQTKHFQGVCYGTVLETGRLFNGIGHNREGGPRIWMSTAASLSCFLNLLTTVDGIQLCFPPTTPRPHWGAWRGGGGSGFPQPRGATIGTLKQTRVLTSYDISHNPTQLSNTQHLSLNQISFYI